MHVISKKRLQEAQLKHQASSSALAGWYKIVSSNPIASFAQLKALFPSVDKVGALYVFNIGGNKLRLIASIHFNRQKLYVRAILSHQQYDKGQWKKHE